MGEVLFTTIEATYANLTTDYRTTRKSLKQIYMLNHSLGASEPAALKLLHTRAAWLAIASLKGRRNLTILHFGCEKGDADHSLKLPCVAGRGQWLRCWLLPLCRA